MRTKKSPQLKSVFFLLDGSGSFCFGPKEQKTPLQQAIDGMTATTKKALNDKSGSDITYIEAALWGDLSKEYKGQQYASTMHPLTMDAAAKAMAHGLNCGTEMVNVPDMFHTMAKHGKRGTSQRLVIVTDGDLFKPDEAAEEFKKLLSQRKNLDICFVVAPFNNGNPCAAFETFINNLDAYKDRFSVTVCKTDYLAEAVEAVATTGKWDSAKADLRENIKALRTQFTTALRKLDNLEASLDAADKPAAKKTAPEKPGYYMTIGKGKP